VTYLKTKGKKMSTPARSKYLKYSNFKLKDDEKGEPLTRNLPQFRREGVFARRSPHQSHDEESAVDARGAASLGPGQPHSRETRAAVGGDLQSDASGLNPQNPNESFHQSDLSFKSHQIEENDNKEFLEEVSGDNNPGNFRFHNSLLGSSHHLTPTSNNKLIKNLNDSFSNQNFGGSNNKVYILIHRTASI